MKMKEINKQIADVLDVQDTHGVQMVTAAFETALLYQLLQQDGSIEFDNIGELRNVDGSIVFKPSAFLTSAAQIVRGKRHDR